MSINKELTKMVVVGLGYVGLPLCVALHQEGYDVVGVDIDQDRLFNLHEGFDYTGLFDHGDPEIEKLLPNLMVTDQMPTDPAYYFICVPTPDDNGTPDYSILDKAVSNVLDAAPGFATIVIESTVAPGTTARLQSIARVRGHDAKFAYSPERINPGPGAYREMRESTKLLACADSDTQLRLRTIYEDIYAKVHCLPDPRAAELAKVFENTQRDMNIALCNELAMQCHRHKIDLPMVMAGVQTKNNALPFHSGMVGGHCIPVDPYYLGEWYGGARDCLPLQSRRVNEQYIQFIAGLPGWHTIKGLPQVLILGSTYKRNVPDFRESGALAVADWLKKKDVPFHVFELFEDNMADLKEYEFNYVIGAVNHNYFKQKRLHDLAQFSDDCVFLNVDGFTTSQTAGFHTTISV